MKTCFKCHRELPITEFYRHPMMADKHLGKCKDCTRKDTEDRRHRLEKESPAWVAKERQRHLDKAAWREKHFPEIGKAARSIRTLPFVPGCDRHHWSYREEHMRDIIVLAEADHRTAHRHMEYDQEQMMFRKQDGELLDSRERHVSYLAEHGVHPAAQAK